jgi:hypothetical protein
VPPSIVQLIAASLAKEPRQRPRDAYAFAERLFELEWANDGKDPNDHTAEGPLSRILSTAGGGGKPSSKNIEVAPPRDRLGNVPLIGVPEEARRGGPTSPGMGAGAPESTMPGEDALLAGLLGRQDVRPRSKKERESGPSIDADKVVIRSVSAAGAAGGVATMDAPASAPKVASAAEVTSDSFSDGTTKKLAPRASYESDTFASQESDARRAPRKTSKLAVPIALGLLAVIGVLSFMAYRGRAPVAAGGGAATTTTSMATTEPVMTAAAVVAVTPSAEPASAPVSAAPVVPVVPAGPGTVARPSGSHRVKAAAPIAAASATPAGGMPAAAPVVTVAPVPAKPVPSSKDESFLRTNTF